MKVRSLHTVTYKRSFFKVKDTFLTDEINGNFDIQYFIQVPKNHENKLSEFHTLLIDLRQDENSIWEKIYHRCRTEISSFLSNTEFDYQIISEIKENELNQFLDLFTVFANSKKIRLPERERLKAYNREGLLFISYLKSKGDFICINIYRVTKERALNLHSFTTSGIIRSEHSNSFFGRAHRCLHWKDLLYFKSLQIASYDFGGWYEGKTNESLLNINQFKEQFGGEKVKEYTGVIYHNIFLKLIHKLKS